jgi:lipoprotein-anchoring transpeptidase ErfK/SrfK
MKSNVHSAHSSARSVHSVKNPNDLMCLVLLDVLTGAIDMNRRSFLKTAMMAGVAAASAMAGVQSAHADDGATDALPARKGKWIEVILAEQRLIAWDDGRAVLSTSISSGTRRTPTVRGSFKIYRKYVRQRMTGPGYNLPNVPYVMYFKGSYALHGTYWHNNFGRPMSHGCVNLPTGTAGWLYEWAPKGTTVVVH